MSLHAVILMVGGHYSYAEVPFGFDLQKIFNLSRNPFDRIGHIFQSFVPAVVIFELLLSYSVLRIGKLMMISVISMCLAFSALYELIEWLSAVILGQGADAFLGTQGDPWDTQWDMFMALVGATLATLWQHCRCLKLSVPK